jgi:hypothetical protein
MGIEHYLQSGDASKSFNDKSPSTLAHAVILVICIREVLGSNLGRDTGYSD